MVGIFLHGVLG